MINKKYCYSTNEEGNYRGTFNTREEAKEELFNVEECSGYTGLIKKPKISDYFDVDNFIEGIDENMGDGEFGFVEDYIIEIRKKDKVKLGIKIKKLIDKYCSTMYYSVDSIKKHEYKTTTARK